MPDKEELNGLSFKGFEDCGKTSTEFFGTRGFKTSVNAKGRQTCSDIWKQTSIMHKKEYKKHLHFYQKITGRIERSAEFLQMPLRVCEYHVAVHDEYTYSYHIAKLESDLKRNI